MFHSTFQSRHLRELPVMDKQESDKGISISTAEAVTATVFWNPKIISFITYLQRVNEYLVNNTQFFWTK